MSHQGNYPPQTLGAVGQPIHEQRAETLPAPRETLPESGWSERALFYAYRHTTVRRRCACHDSDPPMSELEQRQRAMAARTLAEEAREGVA